MAGSLNKVTLIGNVGQDPEIRDLATGQAVANFSLATSETWKNKDGEKQERTEWHRVVVWNDGLVSVIEKYVKKGSKLYIEGQLQTRKWEKDGIERYSTEVVLTGFDAKLLLLGDPGQGRAPDPNGNAERPGNSPRQNSYAEATGRRQPATAEAGGGRFGGDAMDDEIPF